MSNIKLKNASGTEVTYSGVTSLQVPKADGSGNAIYAEGLSGSYSVTLNVDSADWQIISVIQGNSIAKLTNPTKTGYVFSGWSTTQGGAIDITLPYTPTGDVTLYAVFNTIAQLRATPTGYGSSSTSSVTFSPNSNLISWTPDIVTQDGSYFVKFPTFYRKVVASSSGQLTSFIISSWKEDDDFHPYSCFLDEDGNLLPYVLMGQYCSTSSSTANSQSGTAATMTIGAGRTLCQNKGTGYMQMDWQIFKLWQDLLCAKMQTINTNSGSGIAQDVLGVYWQQNSSATYPWVDGVNTVVANKNWVFSYKPSMYVDQATSDSTGYVQADYTFSGSTSGQCISVLGYDTNNEFFNYPKTTVNDSSYTTYYCDAFYFGTSNATYPVLSFVGYSDANRGAFLCDASLSWSVARPVRLCFRPI